jgi:hypothetical protein
VLALAGRLRRWAARAPRSRAVGSAGAAERERGSVLLHCMEREALGCGSIRRRRSLTHTRGFFCSDLRGDNIAPATAPVRRNCERAAALAIPAASRILSVSGALSLVAARICSRARRSSAFIPAASRILSLSGAASIVAARICSRARRSSAFIASSGASVAGVGVGAGGARRSLRSGAGAAASASAAAGLRGCRPVKPQYCSRNSCTVHTASASCRNCALVMAVSADHETSRSPTCVVCCMLLARSHFHAACARRAASASAAATALPAPAGSIALGVLVGAWTGAAVRQG